MRLAVIAAILVSSVASAQSNQRFSLQGSALFANLNGRAYTGLAGGGGGELQVRLTPGALSVGAGAQRTSHGLAGESSRLILAGAFVEPRYVIATRSQRFAPYVGSRVAVLRQSVDYGKLEGSASGLTANLGTGVLIRVSRRFNLEAGGSYGFTRFGDFTLIEEGWGVRSRGESGSGSNIVLRLGLAAGILK
jgi:hypothetical protein